MDFGAKSVLLMMAFFNQVHKAFKMVFVKDILKCFFPISKQIFLNVKNMTHWI